MGAGQFISFILTGEKMKHILQWPLLGDDQNGKGSPLFYSESQSMEYPICPLYAVYRENSSDSWDILQHTTRKRIINSIFTITAQILACSLANFYRQ